MKNLICRMSLTQKVGQLNQYLYGWECYKIINDQVVLSEKLKNHILQFDGIGAIYGLFRADPWSGIDFSKGLTGQQRIELINKIRTFILENCSLPIMPLIVEEMPHGHQGLGAICYPVNISIAATFNEKLYAQALEEQLEYATANYINVGLISGLDVARDSRWGRTEETFGSDPFLASRYTSQIARKFKNDTTVACLKHFVAQGAPYMGLNSGAVNIGERELREIHLPPTAAATKIGVELIMVAYNEIDGIPCHANKWLLSDVLKKELDFDGVLMADGQALNRLISKNISKDNAANLALTAGIGLSLWDDVYLNLEQAVVEGVVSEKLVDERLEKILTLKKKLGLLEYSKIPEKHIKQSNAINYNLATESIILQKNEDSYLPININQKCLVIGDTYDSLYTFLGDYTAYQDTEKFKNLKQIFEENLYDCKCLSINEALSLSNSELIEFDKVIVIGGGTSARDFGMEFESNGALKFGNGVTDSGENVDVGTIDLKHSQYEICNKLTKRNIDYCFICIQGRPYALKEIALNSKAIMSVYYNGQQGPVAVFDTLIGKNNPSGKNPISMPFFPEYFGFEYNSKQDMRNNSYTSGEIKLFEFGHGLSYSKIQYNNFTIIDDKVKIEIENVSNLDAMEAIQVYIKKENSLIVKRQRELVAVKKINVPAGEVVKVEFEIIDDWLKSYDINMKHVIEKGQYELIIGTGTKTFYSETIYRN